MERILQLNGLEAKPQQQKKSQKFVLQKWKFAFLQLKILSF